MQSDDELQVAWVLDRDVSKDDACDDAGQGDEDGFFFESYEGDAQDDGEADAVEDAEEDGAVRHDDEGDEGDDHSQAQDGESAFGDLPGLGTALGVREGFGVGFQGLADADNAEEQDLDDHIGLVELCVEFEDAVVVEVPHEVQEDHEDEGEASDDVEFDETGG